MKADVPEIIKHAGGTIIQADSVNRLVFNMMRGVLGEGTHAGSRNGGATDLKNVEMTLTDPRRRHLHLNGRSSNIFQLMAESMWVLSGKGDINKFLKFFIPRAPQYSDDGKTWRGAYGPRIYDHDQMQGVVDRFKAEGKGCRRAVVDIYQSNLDSPASLKAVYDLDDSKDVPCNDFIFFWIDHDDTFHMKTVQRSGDVVFGAGSINMFEFSFMHEMMYQQVKAVFPELKLGAYHHNTVNLHVYDFTKEQCHDVLTLKQCFEGHPSEYHETFPCIFPDGVADTREFFEALLAIWEEQIAGNYDGHKVSTAIADTFAEWDVTSMNNQLYTYATLVTTYIWSKVSPETMPDQPYIFSASGYDAGSELVHAVMGSKFRKFKAETQW